MHKLLAKQDDLIVDLMDLDEIPSLHMNDLVLVLNILRSKWVQRVSYCTDSSFRIHKQGNPQEHDIHIIRQFLEYLMNSPIIVKCGKNFIDFAKI
ncbi:MAG: hypothetical protein ACE5R6_04150 [Candidatus Heimdallarchaeota archaeon]